MTVILRDIDQKILSYDFKWELAKEIQQNDYLIFKGIQYLFLMITVQR